MKRLLFLILILCIVSPVYAIQDVPKQEYYLSDCIKFAINNSPKIMDAKSKVDIASKLLDLTAKEYVSNSANTGYLELQSARQNYNDAKLDYIDKLKNYNISLSKLENITHIHEKQYYEYMLKSKVGKYLPQDLCNKMFDE